MAASARSATAILHRVDRPFAQTKGFLLDIDSVVLRGARPIEGAVETVKELHSRGYRVGFITNDIETMREACGAKLWRHGFPVTVATMMTAGRG